MNEYTNRILSEIHGRERDRYCTVKAFFEALTDKPEAYSQKLFQALTKSQRIPVKDHFRALQELAYKGLCPLAEPPEYVGSGGRIHPSDVRRAIIQCGNAKKIDLDDAVVPVNEKTAHQRELPLHELYVVRANVRQVFGSIGMHEYPWPEDLAAHDILEQTEIIEAEIKAISNAPAEDTKDVRWKLESIDAKEKKLAALWQQYDRLGGDNETEINAENTKTTVAAETQCKHWLSDLMRKGPKQFPKAKYQEEASCKFEGLSDRGFLRAWGSAKLETEAIEWGKPGRKS